MPFNVLDIKVVQDTRRCVECFIFSSQTIDDVLVNRLVEAHHDVYDMFLRPQPLIVVTDVMSRPVGVVSLNSRLVNPEFLNPPYESFLVNTHALKIIDGKTTTDKIAELSYMKSNKELLVTWLYELGKKGLYTIIAV